MFRLSHCRALVAAASLAITLAPLVMGCAGDAARVNVAGPQLAEMAPTILEDAALGASIRELAGRQERGEVELACDLREALGVDPISPGLAATKAEHRALFRELIMQFARREPPGG